MGSTTDDTARRHRIEMRVTAEQQALIRHAASLANETVTAFVLGTATQRATELVEAQRTVTLPNETFDRFYAALDDPATLVPELAALFRPSRYRRVEPPRAAPRAFARRS